MFIKLTCLTVLLMECLLGGLCSSLFLLSSLSSYIYERQWQMVIAEGQVPMVVSSLFWVLSQPSIYLPDDHASNTCPGAIRKYRKTQRKEKLPESHHPEPGRVRPQCTFLPFHTRVRVRPGGHDFPYTGSSSTPASGPALFTQR